MTRSFRIITLACCLMVAISCKKPLAFEYRDLKDLKVENILSGQPTVSLKLVYFNPNKFGVNLKNVDCNVSIDSMPVGKLSLDTLMHIGAASEFTVPARFNVNLTDVLRNSANIMFREFTISAKGTTKVGKSGIYVTVPFEYSGKHKLNLF